MSEIKLTVAETITMPTKYGVFEMSTYEVIDPSQPNMKYAIVLKTRDVEKHNRPIVRIQSACLFGEIFGSMRCDCGLQLEASLQEINKKGGLLIYLDQEGRGHGLIDKTKEYALQDKGFDTVEASEALHLPVDARDFRVAGEILQLLNISKVRLLTNNPAKITTLNEMGINAERIALETEVNQHNIRYLKTKKRKLGQMLDKYMA